MMVRQFTPAYNDRARRTICPERCFQGPCQRTLELLFALSADGLDKARNVSAGKGLSRIIVIKRAGRSGQTHHRAVASSNQSRISANSISDHASKGNPTYCSAKDACACSEACK